MPNYDKEGYFTDDPVVAAMVLGEMIRRYDWSDTLEIWSAPERLTEVYKDRYCIPWELVKSAIAPVEGKAGFCFNAMYANPSSPRYDVVVDLSLPMTKVAANPITIGKTVGELRELLAAIERAG